MVSFEQGGIYQMGHDCLFANGEDELRSANIPAVSMMVETNEPAPSIKASPRINKPAKDNSNLYKVGFEVISWLNWVIFLFFSFDSPSNENTLSRYENTQAYEVIEVHVFWENWEWSNQGNKWMLTKR